MDPCAIPKPNKEKIEQLFTAIKSTETDNILSACESFIVEDEFFQWEGTPTIRKQREANKLYFLENGGIQLMLSLIQTTADELVKRFAIDVLWAYSETDENRRELLYAGVLPVVCECLKVDSPKVQEGAVGALWQLLEYEPIQNKSIEEGLVEPLLNLLTNSKVTRTQTRAAGCIHLISWNESCRLPMIQASAVEKIISVDTTALMVNYFRLLALGNIMLIPDHLLAIPETARLTALAQILKFVQTETPEGVRSIEDRLMYLWISMRPYVPLVYSPIKEIFLLGMFALANLTGKADNRNLLIQEDLKDKVLCLGWSEIPEAKRFADMIFKNITINSKPSEPPSLYAIVFNYLNNYHRK
jgi:hypothetical protein